METRKVIIEKYPPIKIRIIVPENKDDKIFNTAWYSKNVGEIFYVREARNKDFYSDSFAHFIDYYVVIKSEEGEDFSEYNANIFKRHCTKKI